MPMKTAISIPDTLFNDAERTAKRLGVSRSRLYAIPIQAFLNAHRGLGVREALDSVYSSEDSTIDPILSALQNAAVTPEEW